MKTRVGFVITVTALCQLSFIIGQDSQESVLQDAGSLLGLAWGKEDYNNAAKVLIQFSSQGGNPQDLVGTFESDYSDQRNYVVTASIKEAYLQGNQDVKRFLSDLLFYLNKDYAAELVYIAVKSGQGQPSVFGNLAQAVVVSYGCEGISEVVNNAEDRARQSGQIRKFLDVFVAENIELQGCLRCFDAAPDESQTCIERKLFGQCNDDWMFEGYYCASSCGFCFQSATTEEDAYAPSQSSESASRSVFYNVSPQTQQADYNEIEGDQTPVVSYNDDFEDMEVSEEEPSNVAQEQSPASGNVNDGNNNDNNNNSNPDRKKQLKQQQQQGTPASPNQQPQTPDQLPPVEEPSLLPPSSPLPSPSPSTKPKPSPKPKPTAQDFSNNDEVLSPSQELQVSLQQAQSLVNTPQVEEPIKPATGLQDEDEMPIAEEDQTSEESSVDPTQPAQRRRAVNRSPAQSQGMAHAEGSPVLMTTEVPVDVTSVSDSTLEPPLSETILSGFPGNSMQTRRLPALPMDGEVPAPEPVIEPAKLPKQQPSAAMSNELLERMQTLGANEQQLAVPEAEDSQSQIISTPIEQVFPIEERIIGDVSGTVVSAIPVPEDVGTGAVLALPDLPVLEDSRIFEPLVQSDIFAENFIISPVMESIAQPFVDEPSIIEPAEEVLTTEPDEEVLATAIPDIMPELLDRVPPRLTPRQQEDVDTLVLSVASNTLGIVISLLSAFASEGKSTVIVEGMIQSMEQGFSANIAEALGQLFSDEEVAISFADPAISAIQEGGQPLADVIAQGVLFGIEQGEATSVVPFLNTVLNEEGVVSDLLVSSLGQFLGGTSCEILKEGVELAIKMAKQNQQQTVALSQLALLQLAECGEPLAPITFQSAPRGTGIQTKASSDADNEATTTEVLLKQPTEVEEIANTPTTVQISPVQSPVVSPVAPAANPMTTSVDVSSVFALSKSEVIQSATTVLVRAIIQYSSLQDAATIAAALQESLDQGQVNELIALIIAVD
eukprot:TRINITY_DN11278_c0_g2_i1.p1 TRINITY_DN11278_c0_g2~~TRINITY_DN11278_c0_g2_i1.p1  ORF type:complete len:1001 (+),score=129.06 TRINITY_DN11278_c0_g2_i1:2771-5773(+)